MTITITEKEYNALSFALTQIETELEAASDADYITDAEQVCNALYSIMEKYKKARCKARNFQEARAVVAEKNRGKLRPRDIDRIARKLLRKIKED